jgi:hypothetical protein
MSRHLDAIYTCLRSVAERKGFGQIFFLGHAGLPSYVDNVYTPDNLLEQAWDEHLNEWEFSG